MTARTGRAVWAAPGATSDRRPTLGSEPSARGRDAIPLVEGGSGSNLNGTSRAASVGPAEGPCYDGHSPGSADGPAADAGVPEEFVPEPGQPSRFRLGARDGQGDSRRLISSNDPTVGAGRGRHSPWWLF